MGIWTRIKAFGQSSREQKESDLDREIRNHLDLEAEESGERGARLAFGNAARVKEDVRREWGWIRLEQLARDAGYGLRQLRRNPVFSAVAIAMLALGILYGVLSYAVTQRTNEIGVRMALGATSREILLSFSGHGLLLTLAGLAIGSVLAVFAARLMTTLFYGFVPDYAAAVAAVSVILLLLAAIACLVPARRASRIDPLIALRHD